MGRSCLSARYLIAGIDCFTELFNTLRLRQNGRHSADHTFKRIFLRENVRISIKISMKFVPKSPIDSISASFQIMAWCRPCDKSLSEAMMVSLLTHICVAQPQWVKPSAIHYWEWQKVNGTHGCNFSCYLVPLSLCHFRTYRALVSIRGSWDTWCCCWWVSKWKVAQHAKGVATWNKISVLYISGYHMFNMIIGLGKINDINGWISKFRSLSAAGIF